MKYLSLLVIAVVAALFISWSKIKPIETQGINPLIGNVSYLTKFGKQPGKVTDEDLRIQTHLAYVESKLRQKDVSHMSKALRSKRKHTLDLLHKYWTAGVFPRNYDHREKRVPCFIDKDGRICAVGYLVEQSAGRAAAEDINSRHKYDEVLAMNDKAVDNWVASSGLTKEECAMIQPNYGYNYYPPKGDLSSSYAIGSSFLGGINVGMSAINAININRGACNRAAGFVGLATGAGSAFYGTFRFLNDDSPYWGMGSQNSVSMVNIGLGTVSMILGAWNAFGHHPVKEKGVSWNLHSQPTLTGQTAVGLSFTRRL